MVLPIIVKHGTPMVIDVFVRNGFLQFYVYTCERAVKMNAYYGKSVYAEHYVLQYMHNTHQFHLSRVAFCFDPVTDNHIGFNHLQVTKDGRHYFLTPCSCPHWHAITVKDATRTIQPNFVPIEPDDEEWISNVLVTI